MQKMKKTASEGSEFFICFTSRPSSKSLMSPNRPTSAAATAAPSLSASLSRRLRTSGSIKGGQSPMFPAAAAVAGKKKGSAAFDAAEPSSPKVTCIGQVRVKSKKKKLKNKNLVGNRSRSGRFVGGEASFRRDGGRKHVLNCFVPCGWSGCRGEGEKREKRGRSRSSNSNNTCGAVFVRWLMQDSEVEEERKRREFVGLVVEERGGDQMGLFVREKEVVDHHEVEVFKRREEEVVMVRKEEVEEEEEEEEEEGRVSVCVPPRNALLLMRCRSDPVRMAALANRNWDIPVMKVACEVEEEEEEEEEEEKEEIVENVVYEEKEEEVSEEKREVEEVPICLDVEEVEKEVVVDEGKSEGDGLAVDVEDEKFVVEEGKEEEEVLGEILQGVEKLEGAMVVDELGENELIKETLFVERGKEEVEIKLRRSISCSVTKSSEFAKVKEGGKRQSFSYKEKKDRRHSFSVEREARRHSFCSEKEARRSSFSVDKEGKRRWSFSVEKENLGPKEKPHIQLIEQPKKKEVIVAKEEVKPVMEPKIIEETQVKAVEEVKEKSIVSKGGESQVVEREKKSRELPDCLLLMMYEPKLSMEVSKETWVCSTDFLHWRPNQNPQPNQPNHPSEAKPKDNVGNDNEENKKCTESTNVIAVPTANSATIQQPPSKSPPTVSVIEHKLLKSSAVGPLPQPPFEHFVLTRCKSEPVKSSARLAPESCFWKARHQPIGAAGLGF